MIKTAFNHKIMFFSKKILKLLLMKINKYIVNSMLNYMEQK